MSAETARPSAGTAGRPGDGAWDLGIGRDRTIDGTIERLRKRPDFLAAAEGRRFHTERMTRAGAACRGAIARDAQAPERPAARLHHHQACRQGDGAQPHPAAPARGGRDSGGGGSAGRTRASGGRHRADRPPTRSRGRLRDALAEDLRRAIPAVTRPAAPRPPGQSRGRRASGNRSSGKSGGGQSPTPPLPREAGQPAPSGTADIGASHGRGRGPRITGARGSEGTGARPDITPNTCGGVPDGQ